MTPPLPAVAGAAIAQWAIPPASGGEWSVSPVGSGSPAREASAAEDPSGGFGSMLSGAIGELERTQEAAATQAQALATGQTEDIASVVSAVQEASLSMQLASQVRNKAVEAYSEIFHTQV